MRVFFRLITLGKKSNQSENNNHKTKSKIECTEVAYFFKVGTKQVLSIKYIPLPPLFHGHIISLIRPGIDLSRTVDSPVGIIDTLLPLADPTG